MSGAKEIRSKIKSIKNTQKITKAMEMVAASKMRKAQDRMTATRPYAEKMRNVICHLAHAHAEIKHPFMIEREVKRVGYIVVTSDRGLCGGLNVNLFKKTMIDMTAFLEGSRPKFILEKDNPKMDRMVNYIKAFEIEITQWEGKFKLSQDKNDTDYALAKTELIRQCKNGYKEFIDTIYDRLEVS